MDRRAAAGGEGGWRVLASNCALGASLFVAELSWSHARCDDFGARAWPWRASGSGRKSGVFDGQHTAYARRNGECVWGDVDVSRITEIGEPGAAAVHAGLQG